MSADAKEGAQVETRVDMGARFLDIEAKGDKKIPKKKRKEANGPATNEKKGKKAKGGATKKIGVRESKAMELGKKKIERLLELLHPRDDTGLSVFTHYEFKGKAVKQGIAEALKWAFTVDRSDDLTNEYKGNEVFWDWWSGPMFSKQNETWKAKWFDKDLTNNDVWKEVEAHIKDLKEEWLAIYAQALPKKESLDRLQYHVEQKIKQENILLNPSCSDSAMAEQVSLFLSDTFILIEENGTSITWDEKEKLWTKRKPDRSAVAIAMGLDKLHKKNIIFTDVEAEEKWKKRVSSAGSIGNVLTWLRSKESKWPNPIKNELDRDMWTLPLKDGKIVDFTTLEVRERKKTDLFTSTTDILWLEDHIRHEYDVKYTIMDTSSLQMYKQYVIEKKEEKIWEALEILCPNAYKFCKGPFRHQDRFRTALLQLSLSLTTYCTRKALWIYGDGKGMKSTILESLVAAMGQKACLVHKKVFFKTEEGASGHNTDLMRAEGKRLILVDELARNDQLNETRYKQVVAHGTLSAREIYTGQAEWKAMCMVAILSNVVVPLNFNNNAIADRTMAVKGTTRVFNPFDPTAPLPKDFKNVDEWEDHEDGNGIYWVLKNQITEQWAKLFLVQEDKGGYQNELGCFFILLAHYAHTLVKDPANCGEIPLKKIVNEDFNDFVREADHIHQWMKENCILEDAPEEKKHRTPFEQVVSDYKAYCKAQGIKEVENKYLKQTLKAKGLIVMERPERWDKQRGKMRAFGSAKTFALFQLRASSTSFVSDESVLDEKEKGKETEKKQNVQEYDESLFF